LSGKKLGALLVAHRLEHLVDGGVESRSGRRRAPARIDGRSLHKLLLVPLFCIKLFLFSNTIQTFLRKLF
jgi:hypothetical protein